MPKIIVVIENSENGQPIWDEASVKQLHDTIRPGTKPNHHDGRNNYGDELPHYSCHQHKTDDDKQDPDHFARERATAEQVDANGDPAVNPISSGKYQVET